MAALRGNDARSFLFGLGLTWANVNSMKMRIWVRKNSVQTVSPSMSPLLIAPATVVAM